MRSALTAANGFANLKTDVKGQSATFTVAKTADLKKKLDKIAATNKHVKGYEIQKNADSKGKKESKKGESATKGKDLTVSLKLPNMT